MIAAALKENLQTQINIREHQLVSDVLPSLGGQDRGPDPHELLEAALAACTVITVQMYAHRKQWKLISTDVKIKILSETKEKTVIEREISFRGELDEEQKQRLREIADKCPIHRLLTHPIEITTRLA